MKKAHLLLLSMFLGACTNGTSEHQNLTEEVRTNECVVFVKEKAVEISTAFFLKDKQLITMFAGFDLLTTNQTR